MDVGQSDLNESLSESLTERELEILVCLADGLSNQEIAKKLYLAAQTVRWYNSQIYGKLGVSNRQGAIERAQALGLLSEGAPTSAITGKHNLPAQATRFIGRQHELAELNTLLKDEDTRLITVLASGGMGKTRLALEAARLQIGHYADGVIFVPLAPLGNPNDIITSIAENIGFVFHGENPSAQQLIDFLRERSMLLVLDNFEHLLDGTQLVADLLQVALNVRLMATSREKLNLHSETVYTLRGLDFPTLQTPDDALRFDAVKLFLQSAHRIHSGFELHLGDLDYMTRICRLTEGMPLGIELAAGWVDVLSLEQIAAEIQQGIDILETDMRDVPERHRSIRATFERTWEHLTQDEQTVFMRLSIFRGGFTIQAAQAVAGADVRNLRQLANKALVQVSPDNRHDIHELLRQFGAEKLAASGEQSSIQTKHTAFFADFMQERQGSIFGNHQLEALDQIGADFENVRLAWNALVNQQAFDEMPKFLYGLRFFLDVHSRNQESIDLFEPIANTLLLLPPSDTTELALARLWAQLTWCYDDIGLSEKGVITGEAAIHLLDRHNSPKDLLVAYGGLAVTYMFRGERENTRNLAQKGYELAQQQGDQYWEAHSLLLLSYAARMFSDNLDIVLSPLRQARAIYESLQNTWGMALSYSTEAGSAFSTGDYEQAKYWSAQCQVLAKVLGNAFLIGTTTVYLGIIALWQEDTGQAWNSLRQALRTFWDTGYLHFVLGPILGIAQLLLHEDKDEPAVELLSVMEHYPRYVGMGPVFEVGPHRFDELCQELKTRLGSDHFAAAWTRGKQRELSKVVAQLLSEDINE